MKVCPVCSEAFANDLNFCDVDGAKLKRERGASGAGETSRLWQLLGVGLLLGALALSAVSIFLSKGRPTAYIENQGTAGAESASTRPPASEKQTNQPGTIGSASEGATIPDDATLAELRKKEKASGVQSQNPSTLVENPKASTPQTDESEKKQASADLKATASSDPARLEPVSTAKQVNETREPAPAPASKSAVGVADTKEPKKPGAEAKSPTKDSTAKKKADEKEKEKKGGFLRVFKKIFGKN